ncbi:MAG TPA: dihydrofolate reductase [Desulfuromonadales bacterium]|nr:dihydrofolate reductase [Desulfuromonadales bacterium]
MTETLERRTITNWPEITIVVAMTRQRVIGRKGRLPWHIPEDLRLFRELTTGQTVIMGRETFASIGHPLPERRNIVVTRTLREIAGAEVCQSFSEALKKRTADGKKIFVIGGRTIYRHALPVADAMVVSWIREDYAGDTFFPEADLEAWSVEKVEEHVAFTRVWYKKGNPGPDRCIASGERRRDPWAT